MYKTTVHTAVDCWTTPAATAVFKVAGIDVRLDRACMNVLLNKQVLIFVLVQYELYNVFSTTSS